MAAPINIADPNVKALWHAINQIPDNVLEQYLADNIIDEQEITDISNRLAELCQQHGLNLNVDNQCKQLIRNMVHHAVSHIKHQRSAASQRIKASLCDVSMREIKHAMGQLLNSGQIKLGTAHLGRETHAFEMGDIPEPEEKTEEEREEPNPLPDNQ